MNTDKPNSKQCVYPTPGWRNAFSLFLNFEQNRDIFFGTTFLPMDDCHHIKSYLWCRLEVFIVKLLFSNFAALLSSNIEDTLIFITY